MACPKTRAKAALLPEDTVHFQPDTGRQSPQASCGSKL